MRRHEPSDFEFFFDGGRKDVVVNSAWPDRMCKVRPFSRCVPPAEFALGAPRAACARGMQAIPVLFGRITPGRRKSTSIGRHTGQYLDLPVLTRMGARTGTVCPPVKMRWEPAVGMRPGQPSTGRGRGF